MPLKIFRAIWFVSVLALFATLLYGYAGWQENMIIQDEASGQISMGRDILFYTLLGIFLLVNVLVYLIAKMFAREEHFRAWFHGLVITINIFFIIAMSLIGLYNSFENFDYSRIGFMIYGSIGLIITWALCWPLYLLYRKFFIKQPV
jgi:uncharacterized membrane protein YkvI